MSTSYLRRGVVATIATAALVLGMAIAPTAAIAEEKIPTVEKPVYDDPIPGRALDAKGDKGKPASSVTAPAPAPEVVVEASSGQIELPTSEVDGVETKGAKGSSEATVTGEWQEVGESGVQVAAADVDAGTDAEEPDEAATVEAGVLSSEEATQLGAALAVTLERPTEGEGAAPIAVNVPDELLAGSFGGNYADRLTWVQVPIVDGRPNVKKSTPVAQASAEKSTVLTPAVSDAPVMLMAVAATSTTNGTGSYAATPLKASSTWDVAEQTGAFTWKYDMGVPSASAGPAPSVGLAYNSQAVDGATASTNNQPSAVGEGWDLSASGFIERSYIPCAKDDGASGAVTTSGDLCWRTNNATVSFGGHSGSLIKDDSSGKWRLPNDDGTRFEYLTGTAQGCAPNGTASSDCWKMTTTDGTQYFFGLNRLPGWVTGKAVTNSTWTVPVFGNDVGEPCKAATFAASSCMQAWRWNLDYVVDVHGNAEAFYYTAENNKYLKNKTTTTAYQRGGALARIEYGLRSNNVYGTNAAGYRVLFSYDTKGRCSDATGVKCTTGTLDNAVKPANPAVYPDVPWDRLCTAATCTTAQIAPSFFTNARLATVQSQVLVASAYSNVDKWALSHSYPAPGDGTSPALWMTQVQRTGTAAGQTAIAEPATVFSGTTMQNRVWVVDGLAPLDKWRLSSIKTSLGGVISVNYQGQQCTATQASGILSDLPNNTKWCFPEWWVPDTAIPVGGRQDLFHKYPVTSIIVDGATGGPLSKAQQTQYIYGTPRWRYNDSPLTIANSRTWNIFAGVDTVEVREGDPAAAAAQKVTKYTYYQGMNGDRATTTGGTKTVQVAGTSIPDDRWFGGQMHSQQTLKGVGGAVVSTQVSTPWASPATATSGTRTARLTNVQKTVVTEPVSTGGNRTLETRTTFNDTYGYPLTVSTIPSDAAGTCTTTTYAAPNTTAWVIGLASQVRTVAKTCADASSAQFPADLVSDVKTTYDGGAWGAAATRGLATSTQVVDRYDNGQPHWASGGSQTYDSLGRSLTNTNALGRTSSTAYTPAAAQPLLSTVEKNPAPFLWSTTTTFEPTTGTPATIVDPNGALTSLTVDALGRNSKVWLPLKPKVDNPDSPSLSFAYTLSQAAPNAIKTTTLTGGGNVTAFELFDGLGRSVQTQSAAVGGGAVVKTTNFDDQGRPYFVDNPYWTASISPGTAFFTPDSENNIPSQVVTTYDAVGRTLKTVLNGAGTLRNQTVMAYPGADRVDTTPPQGGTATSVFTNSLGQKKKLVQYLNGTVTGTGQTWSFAYDGAGRNTQMTDPAGNDWTWTFDLLGRRTAQDDADSGVSTATYDLVGNMTSTTDARGKTVTTTYDELNRKKAMYAGDASGAILSEWSYDSVSKGRVTSSTSFVGSTAGTPGTAYKTTVGSYDLAGNPLTTTVSIPAGAPAFAGTSYAVSSYWHPDSTPLAKSVPSVGGLPAEQIRYGYDAWGHLGSVRGASLVLAGTDFSPTGQLSQFNRYDGTNSGYSTYGYDNATGAVLAIKDNAVYGDQGHYVADRTYTRDAVGNVTSSTVAATHPQAQTQKTCYSYDGLRQLTRAWTPNAATACTAAPSAAAMGGPAPMWLDYAYDTLTGNRTSVTSRSSMGTVSTRAYEYPAAGSARPHAVQQVTGAAGQGTGAYGYDESGNQVSRPGQELTFNTVGKVSKVVAGSEVQSNVFDADGNLLLRVSSTDGATLFLGDTTLTQAAGSNVVAGFRTYSGAEGKPVAQRSAKTGTTGSVLTWLFTNLEGTVDVQTTANGSSTVQSYRDPFGAPIADSAQAWADGAGYMNKQVAKAAALTNVGARTYDPALGKFVSVDPVIDTNLPQQNTGYAYSGNNPTTYKDPSGLRLTIGCEPYCGKGAATIAQKLTPRTIRVKNSTAWPTWPPVKNVEYDVRGWPKLNLSLLNPGSARFAPLLINQLDPVKRPPMLDHYSTKRAERSWGPLVEWRPENKGTVDFGISACVGGCINVSLGHDGSGRIGLGFGLKAGVSVSAGVSTESESGLYLGGSCTAVAGPAGVYMEGGIQQNGPLGYGGAGFAAGASAGCSADVGFGW
ncbi:MAG: hypothetical protein K0R99_2870 [Microbacterium sp.]|jgi:RHS repeat-associated protein|uniref:RHS repeat domain-containing protein n=1 Tax=Microbacterium sp. TaxID=51671 RepID=UPI002619F0EC|nr:RHS repeat-associated core domain-containing protein [Microbacterium sp.]MDF2561424.1 hypothetical protein [Microbacterium sp.]